jgi:hypothetical protein
MTSAPRPCWGMPASCCWTATRGDLRRLRAEAGQDPRQERRLLKAVKGLGEVGVDILFREAQVA